MRFNKKSVSMVLAAIVVCVSNVPVKSAPLPISVIASASQAAAGNSGEAEILVHLANPDGSPKGDAKIPGLDIHGGSELKGGPWSFQTLEVPAGYKGRFNVAGRAVELGELRVTITSVGNGLYKLRVLPEAGLPGSIKYLMKWVSGEYLYQISYKEGNNEGTALGVLTIR